jgi:hypothetical protein
MLVARKKLKLRGKVLKWLTAQVRVHNFSLEFSHLWAGQSVFQVCGKDRLGHIVLREDSADVTEAGSQQRRTEIRSKTM